MLKFINFLVITKSVKHKLYKWKEKLNLWNIEGQREIVCTKIKYLQVYESYAVKCAYKCKVDPQGIFVRIKANFSK